MRRARQPAQRPPDEKDDLADTASAGALIELPAGAHEKDRCGTKPIYDASCRRAMGRISRLTCRSRCRRRPRRRAEIPSRQEFETGPAISSMSTSSSHAALDTRDVEAF